MNKNGSSLSRCARGLFLLRNEVYEFFTTAWCRLKLHLFGIYYGRRCQFRGNLLVFKGKDSSITIGDGCTFNSHSRWNFRGINHACIVQTDLGGKITIGNNCGFSGVSIVSSCSVTIGDNVMCGTNVTIGDRNDHEDRYPQFQPLPVKVGNNVWIGMNSVILRGVTIGDNTIIGACSVVTHDIPANVIAAGNPCVVIKSIDTES